MNADLAFCLDRFIDDQLKLIDIALEEIQEREEAERCNIKNEETSPTFIEQRRLNKIKKGTHAEDQVIVNRFIQDLIENGKLDIQSSIHINDIDREGLRAELKTKLSACTSYVARLGKLARAQSNSKAFQQRCHEIVHLLRQTDEFEDKFNKLCNLIEQSNNKNCIENVEEWWKETFGNTITNINQRNRKFNPAISEKNFAALSHKSRVMQRASTMIDKRNTIAQKQQQKNDIIRNFVQRIQSIDERNRQEIQAEDLINQLNESENEVAMDYAKNWLKQRDEMRNQQEENILETKWQVTKAEFNRQRIAQESKRIALAVLLRRLAVGSDNAEHFDQNLNQKISEEQNHCLPVITGDIKDPNVEELPLSIKLVNINIDDWSTNLNKVQDLFISALCLAFLLPVDTIRTECFVSANSTLKTVVLPPYGKILIESLNGTAVDSAARIEAVRKCCMSTNVKIELITVGDFGLNIESKLMDPQWNRKYIFADENNESGQYWKEPLIRGGKSYYCPSGWMRFGIKVAENEQEFDKKWGHWYLAYHGTQGEHAASILSSGLRISTTGCFYQKGRPRVYVSPSIEYCAHPRYARPWKKIKDNGEISWCQLVFQCRVNPESVQKIKPETLTHEDYKETVKIDPNFDNNELTWIIPGKKGVYHMNQDIICYGMMMRVSNVDPKELPQSKWWQSALDIKYDT